MKITRGGLHWVHWVIAIVLGITNWIFSALFKLIPDSWVPELGKKRHVEEAFEEQKGTDRRRSSTNNKFRASLLRRESSVL